MRQVGRRQFLIIMGALFAAPLAAGAQQPRKVYRIGILLGASPVSELVGPEPSHRPLNAFARRLRELGYVYGDNLLTEPRSAEGRPERYPLLAEELVRLRLDVILAATSPGAKALKEATETIPIVMSSAADPVGWGLVASLARPGGNVTGLSLDPGPEIHGKRLELLSEAVPKLSRAAVITGKSGWEQMGADLILAARALGITLFHSELTTVAQFDDAFAAITRERVGALLVPESALNYAHRRRIADFAATHRLPAIYGFTESVEAGGLMAYGADPVAVFRRAAEYVDKILKGAKPADLPVERPSKFDLVVNLKSAEALGLSVPQSILIRADRVIE
jgi:putative ABC transport system substrate-binding protein